METRKLKNFAQNWLTIQTKSIEGVCSALFMLFDHEEKNLKAVAQWPVDSKEPLELVAISKLSVQRRDSVINSNISHEILGNHTFDYLAFPIHIDKQLIGVVAVKTLCLDEKKQQKIIHALTVGTKWLAMPEYTERDPSHFHSTVVKLAVNCLQYDELSKLYVTFISDLTREYDCERVTIGVLKNHFIEVIALSNSAKFDDKSNLIQTISAAMDEAVDQDKVIVYPEIGNDKFLITHAHAELARSYGCGEICTIPMVYKESIFAVLTMERNKNKPFDQQTINICEQSLAIISPLIKLKLDDDLFFIQKMINTSKCFFEKTFGFHYLGFKLLCLALALFTSFSLLVDGDFRIHANAILEGEIQRTVPAQMDGFINSASVRAGDTVLKNEIMATLDEVDLKLEKNQFTAKQQQLKREYREALANGDLTQVTILKAQLTQVSAKIKLKQEQLLRTIIKSPFDGIVIKGDLSQSLGVPVDKGDSLFTIAPLEGYRVILKVNERSISYIRQGQQGILVLSSMPESMFPLQIERITQVATINDGSNVFLVEAALSDLPKLLRPGMEGVGKVDVGRKNLFWILTHELFDWVKLWVWSWWP